MPQQDASNLEALERNLIERTCVADIVARSADLYPGRIAVVDGQRRLDYASFDRQVDQLGHALLGLGLQRHDVVAVMVRNCVELLLTYFASPAQASSAHRSISGCALARSPGACAMRAPTC